MSDLVYALSVFDGDLVAGGFFTQAGNNTGAKRIARFNGTGWQALGGGFDANVNCLLVVGSDLYAGGAFLNSGVTSLPYVARWDGQWNALGTDLNDHVRCLGLYGGNLVAGGWFTAPGGLVAEWTGSAWSALGGGLAGTTSPPAHVSALQEHGGYLYAGGLFTSAEGSPVTHLARWNGLDWEGFGTLTVPGGGWADPVEVLSTEYGGTLVVGGGMSHIEGLYVNGLAAWNGTTWAALGTGLDPGAQILDVAVLHGDLVAFGYFSVPGGGAMVARWDGTAWTSFGSGLGIETPFGGPGAAAVFDGDLYLGGNIALAGEVSSWHIARWMEPATSAVPAPDAPSGLAVYPNPFREATTVAFQLGSESAVSVSVVDISGRVVAKLAGGRRAAGSHLAVWDGTDARGLRAAPGVYLVRLLTDGGVQTLKIARAN